MNKIIIEELLNMKISNINITISIILLENIIITYDKEFRVCTYTLGKKDNKYIKKYVENNNGKYKEI